ncbi:MAG: FlgD immunoglobulin-like domain containing protein [Thermoleophilaceae bacterium]
MGDQRVHPADGRPRGALAQRTAPAAKDVVGGEDPGHPAGQQQRVQGLQRQPLVVHDVGRAGIALGQHPGHVLGQPQRPAGGGPAVAGHGAAVEGLAHGEATGGRGGAVGIAAGDQLDLGAGPGQGRSQGIVVRRGVGRRVDELRRARPAFSPGGSNSVSPVQSSRLVRAVFALLVVATVGIFFAAQALKTEVPVVLRFAAQPRHLSPNEDRVRDSTRVGFDLSEPADVSFSVIDADGGVVREIIGERRLAGDTKHRFTWDGRDDEGRPVPDGAYRLRVVRRSQGRVLDSIKKVIVDTRPPKVSIASVAPNVISPGVRGAPRRVRIRYRGPRNLNPEFRVWHTDVSGPPRIARRFRGDRDRAGVWDGTVRGAPTPDGSYAFTVLVRDLAGNLTEAPAVPRPTAEAARRRTGADVRRLTLRGPSVPVSAGSVAVLRVGPVSRRFRYALSRLGSRAVLKADRRRGGRLRVRIPAKARTGVYLVRVRAGGRRAVWPVPVSGRPVGGRRALGRPRPW